MGQNYCMNHLLGARDSADPQYYFPAITAEEGTRCLCEFFLCFHLAAVFSFLVAFQW